MFELAKDPRRLASGILRRISTATQVRFNYPLWAGASRFKVPVINGVGAELLRNREPWLDAVISLLVREDPTAVFVDVGANIGQTVLKVRAAHPGLAYVAFEPNPYCVHYLRELIQENEQLSDVVVYPVGLSNKTQIMVLILKNEFDQEGTVVHNFRQGDDRKLKVPVALFHPRDLDQAMNFRMLLKVDVEGGELEVLEGLSERLLADRSPVICEVLPPYSADNRVRVERQTALQARLSEWGYVAVRVPTREPPSVVSDFGIHSNLDWINYVLVAKEQSQLIAKVLDLKISPAS